MSFKRFYALLLSFVVAAGAFLSHAHATESAAEYSLREWHAGDGLPDEVVHNVVQDSFGYLWIATESGVTRFNSMRFDVFPLPGASSADMSARGIPAMVNHAEHGLLLAFSNGDMWRWTGSAWERSPLENLFSKGRIALWFVQSDGSLWADFSDGRLEFVRGGQLWKVKLGESKLAGHPLSFADDGQGGVWIAARAALYHLRAEDISNGHERVIVLDPLSGDFDRGEICVASSFHGKPWIITRDVIGRWDGNMISGVVPVSQLLGAHFVHSAVEDRDGNLWVGTRSQGAYVVKADSARIDVVPTSHRTVRSLCQDREGNIWLATNGGGLDRLQVKFFRLYDSTAGLDDDLTFTVCEDRAGMVWLANRDGGMARVQDGKVLRSRPGWPSGSAGRVFPDLAGGVWFTAGSGLFKTDAHGETFGRIDAAPFKNNRVMYVSRSNDLWIGGDAGELACINHKDNTLEMFGSENGFSDERPNCIIENNAGQILVGTNRGNIYRFIPASADKGPGSIDRFESIRAPDAQPLAAVRSLLIDESGALWVGTGGAGVYVITAGQEHRIDHSSGLPDDMISQMLFDDKGRVWFGSSRGIFSAERRELMDFISGIVKQVRPIAFGENEGLEHISCLNGYQPGCWKGRDGTLWFTTRRGVLAINPQVLQADAVSPVLIDEMRVDGQPVTLTGQSNGARGAEPFAPVEMRSDAHRVEFLFSVLNFVAPERVPVRYRLEGFDQTWLPADTARSVIYPRLYPGMYRLRIETANTDGSWSAAEKSSQGCVSLMIVVVPYWWETTWFRAALIIVVTVLLIVGVRTWSFRRLRRKLEYTEREASINRERTRIARDIHDDLGASLTRISLLSQSAPREDAQENLDEIYSTTTTITRSINEIVWALDARHDNLESLLSYFDSYAQNFLSVARIRYRMHAPAQMPRLPVSSRVRHDLFLALKEALNNCVKYAEASEVSISAEIQSDNFILAISDNGQGLPVLVNAIGSSTSTGGGQGLQNLVLRLNAIGGRADVGKSESGGTEVVLSLPIDRIAL